MARDALTSLAFAQAWGLDPLGNWASFREDDDGDTAWDLDQSRTHNDANEIASITGGSWPSPAHDAAGNMTTMPKPNEPTESFTASYDAWNRLVKLTDDAAGNADVAEYRYDGRGRRIVAEVYVSGSLDHTRHFYYHDHSIIEERVDGTASGDMDIQYVWGLRYVDELIARHDGTNRLYALQDANYRVTAIVDDTGAVEERYSYTPYGERTVLNPNWSVHNEPHEGSFNFRIGHQGLRHDEAGLVYIRARVLHVGVGRFVQRDPLGYVDGMSLYGYVESLPLHLLDPLGLQSIPGGPYDPDSRTNNVSPVRRLCDDLAAYGLSRLNTSEERRAWRRFTSGDGGDLWFSESSVRRGVLNSETFRRELEKLSIECAVSGWSDGWNQTRVSGEIGDPLVLVVGRVSLVLDWRCTDCA